MKGPRTNGSLGAVLAALGVTTFAAQGRADDSTAAQALFNQARRAMAEHHYADACPKLEESLRLEYALGTLLNLADCEERTGKLATAWTRFLELASKARESGQLDRARIGRERAAALEPRLSNLVIDVPPESRVEGLLVQRDGTPIGSAQWGTSIPADPGSHVVVASARGRQSWSTKVNVTDGATTARVIVPPLAVEPQATSPVAAVPGAPAVTSALATEGSSPPTSASEAPPASGGLGVPKTLAIISGAVGLAAVGVGAYFGLRSISDHRDVSNESAGADCRPVGSSVTGCSGQGAASVVHLAGEAQTAGTISTVAFVVGGVALAGAVTLWVVAPRGPVHTQVGIGAGRLMVRGEW